jgi:hypothetical protein
VGDGQRRAVQAWLGPWVERSSKLSGVLQLCDGNDLREQLIEVASQPIDALNVGLDNLREQICAGQRAAQLLESGETGGSQSEAEQALRQINEEEQALQFFVDLTQEALRKLAAKARGSSSSDDDRQEKEVDNLSMGVSLRPLELLGDTDEAEMKEMVALMRIQMAGKLLVEGEYESARVAFSSALLMCSGGEREEEARRGLEQSLKGLKFEQQMQAAETGGPPAVVPEVSIVAS